MAQGIERLTPRQKDCLRLVGQGYTSKQIGRRIGISPATVDNHIRDALSMLEVNGRAEAARLLLAFDPDQLLTSQAHSVADRSVTASLNASRDSMPAHWFRRWVPPFGGTRNDLSPGGRIVAILMVAALGMTGVIMLTLCAAAVLWVLR